MVSTDNDKYDVSDPIVKEVMEAKTKEERRTKAIEAILEYRKTAPRISDEETYRIRQEIRDSILVD